MIFFWLQELYMHMNILFLKLHTFVPFYHTHILTIYILHWRTYLDQGVQRPLSVDQLPVLVVLGSVSDFRMLYQTHPHLPTIFAFLVSLQSYSLLAPPIQWPYHLISTISLTWGLQAPPPLLNLNVWYPDFHLSVATCNFLFWTDQFPWPLPLAPFLFPRCDFLMSIPPSWSSDLIPTVDTIHNLQVS